MHPAAVFVTAPEFVPLTTLMRPSQPTPPALGAPESALALTRAPRSVQSRQDHPSQAAVSGRMFVGDAAEAATEP